MPFAKLKANAAANPMRRRGNEHDVGITDCSGVDTFNVLRLLGSDNILQSEQGLYLHLVVADCVLTRDLDGPVAAGLSTLIR